MGSSLSVVTIAPTTNDKLSIRSKRHEKTIGNSAEIKGILNYLGYR